MNSSGSSGTILHSEFSELYLEIDGQTGAPARIWSGSDEGRAIELDCAVTIVSGGDERHGLVEGGVYPPWGLTYPDTELVDLVGGELEPRRSEIGLAGRTFIVTVGTTRPELWRATWRYEFRSTAPHIAIGLDLHALTDDAVARDVGFHIAPRLPDRTDWRVHAPGNMIRPDLPLEDLANPVAVSTAGGVSGSAGIVAFERPAGPETLVVWPLSTTEIGSVLLAPEGERAILDWDTWVAGQPGAGGRLRLRSLYLDLLGESFASVLEEVPASLERLGITSPAAPPSWAASASIYEVQIGFSVFPGDHRYAPYPEPQDLLDDLDRIADLGYDTLQLMPRQPYPSYNVHDYADIDTTYGDEAVIRRIVDACHERAMRVILDILIHGVVDGEVVQAVVDGIESGPYRDRLDEELGDMSTEDLGESDAANIGWCQHLVNFAPYWIAGSPWRHPLLEEHPEWFFRDSAGDVTGAYTRAFDSAHPGWQRYFIDSALALVQRLDIDGFRIDAPSYNMMQNWSPRTRANASVSTLGCLPMFDQLRAELHTLKPDALLYTEPSGLLYRQAMDVNYNYDELWLIRAALEAGAGRGQWVRNGQDLGRWFAQRDATLPRGSITAHHVDSHDTFWWPRPGYKWRREQYGPRATAAMMAVFALSGGPYMTFVGGEVDIEDRVRAVHRLRTEHEAFASGTSDYDSVVVDDDDVYAVLRRSGPATGLLLVNLADRAATVRVSVPHSFVDLTGPITPDHLGGGGISWRRVAETCEATVQLAPYQAVAGPLT